MAKAYFRAGKSGKDGKAGKAESNFKQIPVAAFRSEETKAAIAQILALRPKIAALKAKDKAARDVLSNAIAKDKGFPVNIGTSKLNDDGTGNISWIEADFKPEKEEPEYNGPTF